MNRKRLYDRTYKEIFWIIGCSIATIFVISRGNVNFGLYDDNQAQWLPILDTAYAEFFRSGHFPVYDWFQMKGMVIYDQGYYGSWNPFMMAAYLVNTYVLGWLGSNTITVYITEMIVLGNICCFYLFRMYGVQRRYALLGSQLLCSATIFFSLAYWYYVFNVYFIFPWLLFTLLKYQGKKGYYCHGAVLSVSVLMGNIQYTVYMCLAYAVIMFFLSHADRGKYLIQFCTNMGIMGVFSSSYLVMLLRVSARSADFADSNSAYYDMTVHPVWFGLFSWIPSELTGNGRIVVEKFFSGITIPGSGGVDAFPKAGSMYMGVMILCAVIFAVKRKQYCKDKMLQFAQACLVCAGVLLFLSFGKIGLLAILMEKIPMWNSFRILSKFLVLLPVLLLPVTALVMKNELRRGRGLRLAVSVFFLLGICQSETVSQGAPKVELSDTCNQLQKIGVESEKYRIAGISSYQEISYEGDWKSFQEKEHLNLYEKVSKNAGTTAGLYTLGGYDLSFENNRFTLSDAIMQSKSGYASEFGYDNLMISDYFWNDMDRDSIEYEQKVKRWREQIERNCVKYFIMTRNSAETERLQQLITDAGLQIEWKRDFMEHTCMISIRDIRPLAVDQNGREVRFEGSMDRIIIPSVRAEKIYLSFAYDRHIRAFLEQDGKTKPLEVQPDANGYLVIAQNREKAERIVVTYEDKLYLFGKIWTVIVVVGIILCFFLPEGRRKYKRRWSFTRVHQCFAAVCSQRKTDRLAWKILYLAGGVYVIFMGVMYGSVRVTCLDEIWFSDMFRTIHHHFMENPFTLIAETENYLGYGQIYWIIGGLVNHMLLLRGLSLISLFGCFVLLLKIVEKVWGRDYIPYAGLCWLSMPYAWYTDKIIGPELPGLFLALIGYYCSMQLKEKRFCGWILMGVGCAFKINYAVFIVLAFWQNCNKERKDWKNMAGECFLQAAGCGIGYMMANPMILLSPGTFLENGRLSGGVDLNMLAEVIMRKRKEWDGVMTNGLCYGYVHWIVILLLMLWCFMKKQRYQQMMPVLGCSVLLLYICSRTSFLGWYLLPLLFFFPLILCEIWKNQGKDEKAGRWGMLCLIVLNGLLLFPVHMQERSADLRQLQMAMRKEENVEQLKRKTEELRQEYPQETIFYLTEFLYDRYSYNFEDYYRFCIVKESGIAVIGQRMLHVPAIEAALSDTENNNGAHIEKITSWDGMVVVRRSYE